MKINIGIDLGNTYSCVSYVNEFGMESIIEAAEGGSNIPSVVYFDPETNEAVVGSIAREEGAMHPESMVERVKNYMGDPNYILNINGVDYSPAAISALILRKLVSDAEKWLEDEEIEGAVITCPVWFSSYAREATRVAGENVVMSNGQKLKVLQLLDEPVAAALAYGESCHEDMQRNILVYDLGGSTFNVTLLKLEVIGDKSNVSIIAVDGNCQLGGKDWDAALADYVRNKFCEETGADPDEIFSDPEQIQWYSERIEKTKQILTMREVAKLIPSFNGEKTQIEITREIFDSETESLLNQTIQIIDDMMEKKGITIANDVDEILLVGGSTRMPQVERCLQMEYNKPIRAYASDKIVAMGAALVANGYGYTVQDTHYEPRHGRTRCSVGIEIFHRRHSSAVTLIENGSTTPKFVSTKDYMQIKLGSKYNPRKEITAILYKYSSRDNLVELDECFECAQVEFSNKWHLKNNSDIWFDLEYNDGWNNESDYLTIHYGQENLTEKKEVKWKKIVTIME